MRGAILRISALVAVLLVTIPLYINLAHSRSPHLPEHGGRRSVAVFGFKNLSGQSRVADISNALATGFTEELRAGEDLRVISAEDVMRVRLDLRLPDVESYARDTLARIRDNTGADLVVLGSYLSTDPNRNGPIRLYVVAQDANSGEAIVSLKQDGAENDLRDLISHSVDQLRAQLHIGDRSASQERIAVPRSLPTPTRCGYTLRDRRSNRSMTTWPPAICFRKPSQSSRRMLRRTPS